MAKYILTGGVPLTGTVELAGAKNAGFKAIIASLLGDSPSTICDLGLISEIDFAKKVIASLGGKVNAKSDPHCLEIDPSGINSTALEKELSAKSRFSIMYAGPLLAKFGQMDLPQPGGDVSIGKRPLNRHLDGLKALGVKITSVNNQLHLAAKDGLTGTRLRFPKNTHNGTEVLIIAAVKAKGTTILENAAHEPEIDDLIKFLNLMGAQITRVEPRTVKIIGVKNLHGASHSVMRDRNEAVTFACAALATKGKIFIPNADKTVLEAFIQKVKEIGGSVEEKDDGLIFSWTKDLVATDMETNPYPGFMTDWQPLWTILTTQCYGVSTVHETVYERRFDFVPALCQMGAKIKFFQPNVTDPDSVYNFNVEDDSPQNEHAIKIYGPTKLTGTKLEINDIRSGATALLAGCLASGQTIISDPKDQIKRGYEDLVGSLNSLGAKIKVE